MSTAATVPEIAGLDGEDALETLRRYGRWHLVRDAVIRFRAADGTSHSRALGLNVLLVVLPAIITLEALVTVLGGDEAGRVLAATLRELTPGAAESVLDQAAQQGALRSRQGVVALVVGVLATVAALTTTMAQIERGANRIYGVERDRPFVAKYRRGLVLGLSAGVLIGAAFALLVGGQAAGRAVQRVTGAGEWLEEVGEVVQWPLGVLLAVAAFALLFEQSPRRRQPGASWLAVGAVVSVLLWLVFTGLLALYAGHSSSLGATYGPLAGIIALVLWAFASSVALLLGIAFAAQLEAVRHGQPQPAESDEEVLAEQGIAALRRPEPADPR